MLLRRSSVSLRRVRPQVAQCARHEAGICHESARSRRGCCTPKRRLTNRHSCARDPARSCARAERISRTANVKETIMKKTLVAVAAVGALGLAAIPVAEAHDNAGPFIAGAVIGTVLSHPPVAYVPSPAAVVLPGAAPVIYGPPVVYRPAPVVYAPAPYVVTRPVVVRAPGWRGHGHGRPVYGWH